MDVDSPAGCNSLYDVCAFECIFPCTVTLS